MSEQEIVKMHVCKECSRTCYVSDIACYYCESADFNSDGFFAKKNLNEIETTNWFDDLKLGDEVEVEVSNGRWQTAKFVIVDEKDHVNLLVNGQKSVSYWAKKKYIRQPIKQRMRKGQPILVNHGEALRLFKRFDEDGRAVVVIADYISVEYTWDNWRLPTGKELKAIGHDNCGWLTQEKEEN